MTREEEGGEEAGAILLGTIVLQKPIRVETVALAHSSNVIGHSSQVVDAVAGSLGPVTNTRFGKRLQSRQY